MTDPRPGDTEYYGVVGYPSEGLLPSGEPEMPRLTNEEAAGVKDWLRIQELQGQLAEAKAETKRWRDACNTPSAYRQIKELERELAEAKTAMVRLGKERDDWENQVDENIIRANELRAALDRERAWIDEVAAWMVKHAERWPKTSIASKLNDMVARKP